jgi:16S rRNA (cytosine967-C5)-methyltransferase
LKAPHLDARRKEQVSVLDAAGRLVRPGGRLVYVTCSVLPEENTDQIAAFLERQTGFETVPFADVWQQVLPGAPPASADGRSDGLLLTPFSHGTDGFYVHVLQRAA